MSERRQTLDLQEALDLARQHHTVGRLSQAETIYQQILQSDPNQADAMHLLGVIAHQVGRNDTAVDQITKALAIKPELAEAHSNLGLALHELGKLEEAVTSYQAALKLAPEYAEARNNLGNVLQDLGRQEDAAASFQKALRLRPDFAEAHNNLGNALKDLGKLDEAVTCYQKALAIKPDFIEAYYNCGFAAELQEGKESFDPQLLLDQCFAAISLDKYSEATRIMEKLCLHTPFKTQQYVFAFIDRWCEAISRMLDNQQFDVAGKRIRWLYTRITDHKPFNALIQRYFDETKNEKTFATLIGHQKALQLSMQSQYFFQNGQYDEAKECAKRCVNETKPLLEDEARRDDGWLLVKKSLKSIKDSEKARSILEHLLLGIV